MAVLTALQQAAITRLTLSWEFVTLDELESLRQLKILMSGSKNHQIYRDEVQRLTFFLHNIEEDIGDNYCYYCSFVLLIYLYLYLNNKNQLGGAKTTLLQYTRPQ